MIVLFSAVLREAPWVSITQVLTHARVPIIKLDARFEGQREVRVDLSLECPQHTGIATAALVCALGARLPPLVPLTLVLKSFLRKRGLCDPYTGGLPSYGLALMATFLLLRSRKRLQVTDRPPPSLSIGRYSWGSVWCVTCCRIPTEPEGRHGPDRDLLHPARLLVVGGRGALPLPPSLRHPRLPLPVLPLARLVPVPRLHALPARLAQPPAARVGERQEGRGG